MPDIPAEAVQAAAKAGSLHFEFCDEPRWQDCPECVRVMDMTERVLKAAAPFMVGMGSPVSCPSAAPKSTQSPESPSVAPVYRPGVERPAETLSAPRSHPHAAALRQRYANAIGFAPDMPVADLVDAVLAVRDDELADLRRQWQDLRERLAEEIWKREQAEATIARVRALHQPTDGMGFNCDEDPTPGSYGHIARVCISCGTPGELGVRWPCPTVLALDGAGAVSEEQT